MLLPSLTWIMMLLHFQVGLRYVQVLFGYCLLFFVFCVALANIYDETSTKTLFENHMSPHVIMVIKSACLLIPLLKT